MTPKKTFEKQWMRVEIGLKEGIKIIEDYPLNNGRTADLALLRNEECLAIGKFYPALVQEVKEYSRNYFHGDHCFIGCGTSSKLWFHFDKDRIIINDQRYVYPFDEKMEDYREFAERLKKDKA